MHKRPNDNTYSNSSITSTTVLRPSSSTRTDASSATSSVRCGEFVWCDSLRATASVTHCVRAGKGKTASALDYPSFGQPPADRPRRTASFCLPTTFFRCMLALNTERRASRDHLVAPCAMFTDVSVSIEDVAYLSSDRYLLSVLPSILNLCTVAMSVKHTPIAVPYRLMLSFSLPLPNCNQGSGWALLHERALVTRRTISMLDKSTIRRVPIRAPFAFCEFPIQVEAACDVSIFTWRSDPVRWPAVTTVRLAFFPLDGLHLFSLSSTNGQSLPRAHSPKLSHG